MAQSSYLIEVLNLLSRGKYKVTLHAKQRMAERKITHADIKHCALTGYAKLFEDKIKVTGLDCDSESMTLICVNGNGVILITVF